VLAAADATFWATLGGAVATFLAVAVALFGPGWQVRRRRPSLTVTPDPPGVGTTLDDEGGVLMMLRVENAEGRDLATDVEVICSVAGLASGANIEVCSDEVNLDFENYFSTRSVATRSVPAGATRRVSFLHLHSREGNGAAHVAAIHPQREEVSRLTESNPYAVYVTIMGANFDALNYRGTVSLVRSSEPDGPHWLETVEVTWTDPLHVVTRREEQDAGSNIYTRTAWAVWDGGKRPWAK
jgi:hypothetical protein